MDLTIPDSVIELQKQKQAAIVDQIREDNYFPQLSVLEQEYMAKAMVGQKENIVKP